MPTFLRTVLAAALALFVVAPQAGAAVADQPPFDREVMKETYKPIGFFKPGDPIPTSSAPPEPTGGVKIYNPSGEWNAYDTNVYEALNFPSRQADDQTSDDAPGTGDPRPGFCPPDPAFMPYGKCANHQLEWLDYYEETMKEVLKDFGVTVKRYKFESPGSGTAGRPGNPGATATPGGDSYNISATVPGADNPEEQIIVSGHYDFTDSGPAAAWDSQEGHAQVIRMAKIMADYWRRTGTRPSATVKFMPWDQEETGTIGSTVWVRDNIPPGHEDKVRGYFNVDPCAGAYPAYYKGNPAIRHPMVMQLADEANAINGEAAARITAFNARAETIVDEFFEDIDDTVQTGPPGVGPAQPIYRMEDRDEIVTAKGGLLLFSSDYRNFEAIGVPFMNMSPDMFGPKADPGANSPQQSNEGIAILHTPRDNLTTLNALTSTQSEQTPVSLASDGWIKGMELCAQLESRYMLQPEMGGAQTANFAPVAYFEALPNEAIKGQNVAFDAEGSHRLIQINPTRQYAPEGDLEYTWNFGDGTDPVTESDPRINRAYAEVGKYTATLTVKSKATGQTDTMSIPIEVIGSNFAPPSLDKPEPEDADGTFPLKWEYDPAASEREDLKDFIVEEAPNATTFLADDASDIAKNWVVQAPDNEAIVPWQHSDADKSTQVRQPEIFRSEPRSFYTGVPPGENNVPLNGPSAGTSILDLKEPLQLPVKQDIELNYWSDFANDANDFGRVEVAIDTGGAAPLDYEVVDFVGGDVGDTTCGFDCVAARGPQFELRRVDLSAFAGRKVRVRFVYALGAPQYINVVRAGWYVDDISITGGTFEKIGETPEKTFTVTGKKQGAYAYRVRARFSDGVTSSGSNVEAVRVTSGTGPGGNGPGGTNNPGGNTNNPGGDGKPGDPPGFVACTAGSAFRSAGARPSGRGLRLTFTRRGSSPVTVEVFRTSKGRRALRPQRVARFTSKRRSFTWNGRVRGRSAPAGTYFVRYKSRFAGGTDVRRVVLTRSRGRFKVTRPFSERSTCGLLRTFVLSSPTFGGRKRTALVASYRVGQNARVSVDVFRGLKSRKPIRRYSSSGDRIGGRLYRVRVPSRAARSGMYRVRVTVRTADDKRVVRTLYSRLL